MPHGCVVAPKTTIQRWPHDVLVSIKINKYTCDRKKRGRAQHSWYAQYPDPSRSPGVIHFARMAWSREEDREAWGNGSEDGVDHCMLSWRGWHWTDHQTAVVPVVVANVLARDKNGRYKEAELTVDNRQKGFVLLVYDWRQATKWWLVELQRIHDSRTKRTILEGTTSYHLEWQTPKASENCIVRPEDEVDSKDLETLVKRLDEGFFNDGTCSLWGDELRLLDTRSEKCALGSRSTGGKKAENNEGNGKETQVAGAEEGRDEKVGGEEGDVLTSEP